MSLNIAHYNTRVSRPRHAQEFKTFLEEEKKARSTVDYPSSFYWKKLLELFPDAKVVLTTRNPETWRKSVLESICFFKQIVGQFPVCIVGEWIGVSPKFRVPMEVCEAFPDGYSHSVISASEAGDKEAQDFFNKWNAEVLATVPKERMLVFQAKEGWAPLCQFLGVPVPEGVEYPRANDTAEFRGTVKKVRALSYAILFGVPIIAAVLMRLLASVIF